MGLSENKTILLVEDEAVIALAEKRTLERYGFEVLCVYRGEDAVSLVERSPVISLILMDINLGGGIDGTRAARIILSKREIPIIFLSSHTEREVVEKTEDITSFGYVVKNSNEAVLIASIKMAFRLLESRNKERELEEFRSRVFEDSKIPIVVMDGVTFGIVDCNSAAVSIFGYSAKKEVLGKSPSDVSAPVQYGGASSQEKILRNIAAAKKDSQAVFEWLFQRPSGEIWDAEVHLMPFRSDERDYLQFTILDISARKKAEAKLLESNRMMETLLSNLPGMAYRCENAQNWRMLFVSQGCSELTGHSPDEIRTNRPAYGDLIQDEDRDAVWAAVQSAVSRRKPFEINYRIKISGTAVKWVWERGRGVYDDEGSLLFIEGFITDVTERRGCGERACGAKEDG